MMRDRNRTPTEFRVGINQAKRLAAELVGVVFNYKDKKPMSRDDILADIMTGESLLAGVPLKVVESGVGYCPPGKRAAEADPDLLMAYHPEIA